VRVDEHTIELAGSPVFYRSTGRPDTLFLHGVPTSSDIWLPFLDRSGGIAPDLIGFGRTGKGGHLDYTIEGHADFIQALLDHLGIDRVGLVMHGWGAAGGLALAQRDPGRINRLVLINAVPLLAEFRLPRFARAWRTPLLGELVMGATTKWLFKRTLRRGGDWSDEDLNAVWEQFDQGTQRAILRLHRSLHTMSVANLDIDSLVLWGEDDPWLAPEVGETYAASLPSASLERIPNARHWPWLDQPSVIERAASFLGP
jgi:pimeloyl-ACP methyl ester carboxylesterase